MYGHAFGDSNWQQLRVYPVPSATSPVTHNTKGGVGSFGHSGENAERGRPVVRGVEQIAKIF
eukprot:12424627-Karenia_brevis.AAC.1